MHAQQNECWHESRAQSLGTASRHTGHTASESMLLLLQLLLLPAVHVLPLQVLPLGGMARVDDGVRV